MIKRIILCLFAISTLTACNYNIVAAPVTINIDKAIIRMPDGTTRSGKLESWAERNNEVIVNINGTTYITHFSNVVLISGEDLPAKE